MDNLLENLNKEQLEAVMHKAGPLLIVAGAGTGKTTVIAQRIAYLIEQQLARPEEILALTFTEKAAGEMEERVDRLVPMGYLDLWISTFHSFGERILSANGLDIGLPADGRLLNEFEQWSLIKKNFDRFNLDYYRPLGNPTKFIHALVKHFSRLKDEDISPAEYLGYSDELRQNMDVMFGARDKRQETRNKKQTNSKSQKSNIDVDGKIDRDIAIQEISRIGELAGAYHTYQQLLLDNSALDFGDLINYCLKLFRERPNILAYYQRQFKYILVDEFQDTNWAQYEMVKILAGSKKNLVVVGDDDQSIYKFRGASISNILQFKKDFPDAKEIVLVDNYRNSQNILDLAYDFIQLNNPNRLESQLKSGDGKSKLSKKLKSQTEAVGDIEIIKGIDLADEISQVVERIADIKISDKDSGWNDFGILVRANESAKEVCSYLETAGLPYIFMASRGLYAKPLILDVVAYFKLLDSYHESPALYRILNLKFLGFSYQELVNFNYWARKKTWSLYEVLKNARNFNIGKDTVAKIEKVLKLIEKHSSLARERSVSELMLAFLNDSGYLKYITDMEESKAKEQIAYLNKFKKRIDGFEASNDDKSVKAFVNELDIEIESGEEGGISPDIESGPEAIKVMTVHSAKGLEFKYVFITNMVDKRFPTIARSEAISIPEELVKEILPEGDFHLEEERRLFYVAVTRAKRGLYLSWAPDYGGARKKKASRFLTECGLKDESEEPERGDDEKKLSKIKKTSHAEESFVFKPPDYYSYTQLAAFKNCPYQYRFAHVLKVPTAQKAVFSFGQTMHLTLQKFFQLIIEKRGLGQGNLFERASADDSGKVKIDFKEMKKLYEDCWIDNWYENKSQKDKYRQLGLDSLKTFYEIHKDNWPNVVSLEQGINLKLGTKRIYGKIDRVDDLGEDGIKIVDYKTGAPKSEEKISIDDKEQLLLYQMAMMQISNRPIKKLQFYYLNNNSTIDFVGGDKDIASMEEKVIGQIAGIEDAFKTGIFEPKPGPLCKYCDFNGICEFRKT